MSFEQVETMDKKNTDCREAIPLKIERSIAHHSRQSPANTWVIERNTTQLTIGL